MNRRVGRWLNWEVATFFFKKTCKVGKVLTQLQQRFTVCHPFISRENQDLFAITAWALENERRLLFDGSEKCLSTLNIAYDTTNSKP